MAPKAEKDTRTGSRESQWMGTKYNDTFMIKSITLYDSLKKNQKKKQFLEALYEKKMVMAIKLLEKKLCGLYIITFPTTHHSITSSLMLSCVLFLR